MEFNKQLYIPAAIPPGWQNATGIALTHDGAPHIAGINALAILDPADNQLKVATGTGGVLGTSPAGRTWWDTRTTIVAAGAAPGADTIIHASLNVEPYTRVVGVVLLDTSDATDMAVYVEQCADDNYTDKLRYESKFLFDAITDREGNTYHWCAFDAVLGMKFARVVLRPHASVAMTALHAQTYLTTVVR